MVETRYVSSPDEFQIFSVLTGAFFVFCEIRDIYRTATMLKLFLKSRNNRRLLMPLKNRGRWPSGKETIKMPIMLTRKDGLPTPFRNAEYIPFYYFIPKSILSRCGAELNAIPRNPQVLLRNRADCEFVESDLFRLAHHRRHCLYGLAIYGLRRVYENLLRL